MAVGRKRFAPRDSSRTRLWIAIALAVFVLVDIALILWALSSIRASANGAAAVRPSLRSISPTTVSRLQPGLLDVAMTVPTITRAPTRVLAALDEFAASGAMIGSSPATPAAPDLTTDAGGAGAMNDASDATDVAQSWSAITPLPGAFGLVETDSGYILLSRLVLGSAPG